MPVEMSITIRGDDKIRNKMKAVAKGVNGKPMKLAVMRASLKVEREAKRKVPVHEGRLRNSITTQISREPRGIIGKVGTKVKYAPFVEFGTRKHFPPPSALERWVRLKLKVAQDQVKTVAFLVARKISKRGTKPQPFLRPALLESRAFINREIRKAVERLVR